MKHTTTTTATLATLLFVLAASGGPQEALAAPPNITLETTPLEVDEGGELPLVVSVDDPDGDTFNVYWELTGDGFFDDATGTTTTFSALGFDGDITATLSVKAVDSGGEERVLDFDVDIFNVAPVFISDPSVEPGLDLYRGVEWVYYIEVEDPANADGTERDPVIIDVVEKPAGMIYFGDMHLAWTPRIDGSDTGLHILRIEADDREAEAPAVQQVTLEVLENAPPSAPTIVSPSATAVPDTRPTLTVDNADDIDEDMLSYYYEVATAEDFVTIVSTGREFEGTDGRTSWVVTTTLMDATRYYWRVWANDGRADGPSVSTWFDIDTSIIPPDAATDTSTDTATDPWIPPTWGDEGGCGCRTVPPGGSALEWMLVALALLGLALRGRRP